VRAEREAELKEFEQEAPLWYHTYQTWSTYPLFVLGLMFIAALSIRVLGIEDPIDQRFAAIVIPVAWVIFVVDYTIGLALASHKWVYIRNHPLLLFALVFPPLRILMVFHVFAVLKQTASIGVRVRTYLLFVTTLVAFISAVLEVFFERRAADSNIRSFGDALWWVGETVSTVGYGDYYPVTVGGRLVAILLFVNGVALVSVLTAGLAQSYTRADADEREAKAKAAAAAATGAPSAPHAAATPATSLVTVPKEVLDGLQSRLTNMENDLRTLAAHVTGRSDTPDS